MAKRSQKGKPKRKKWTVATPKPLAQKALATLVSQASKQRKVIDFNAAKLARENLQAALEQDEDISAQVDPAARIYNHAIAIMTTIANGFGELPAFHKLMTRIEQAEEEYMPQGPPMSPLTHSYFLLWTLVDLPQGIGRETLGSVVEAALRQFGKDGDLVEVVGKLNRSRLGLFVQEAGNGNRLTLREMVTGTVAEYACDSGYEGVPGNVLLVRALPPPMSAFDHGVIPMTPYQVMSPGQAGWLRYFERTRAATGEASPAKAYEALMKWGFGEHGAKHWPEYIFEAYANHSDSTVFLTGLPDVEESRPHSRINSAV